MKTTYAQFKKHMYGECKTKLTYAEWSKKNDKGLKNLFKKFKDDTKPQKYLVAIKGPNKRNEIFEFKNLMDAEDFQNYAHKIGAKTALSKVAE